MTCAVHPVYMIHNLQILHREIAIEGDEQVVTIFKIFSEHDIPVLIEMLRELEGYRSGNPSNRTASA